MELTVTFNYNGSKCITEFIFGTLGENRAPETGAAANEVRDYSATDNVP
jgi:hypothetical protein